MHQRDLTLQNHVNVSGGQYRYRRIRTIYQQKGFFSLLRLKEFVSCQVHLQQPRR
jgi:hypothetical protein